MARKTKKVVVAELRADVAGIRGDVKKATGYFNQAQKDIHRSVQSIGAVFKTALGIGATVVAGRMTQGFVKMVGSMAQAGEKANDIKGAFLALGGTADSINKAKTALLGTVSAFELMQVANKGLIKGLPGFNQHFADLADIAGRVGEALGIEAPEAISKFTTALVGGRKRGIEQFGFALGDAKSKAEIYAKVISQIPAQLAKLGPMAESAGKNYTALNVAIKDGYTEAGQAIDKNTDLATSFKTLTQTVDKINWTEFGNSLAGVATVLVNIANDVLPPTVQWFNRLAFAIDLVTEATTKAKAASLAVKVSNLEEEFAGTRRAKGSSVWSYLTTGDAGGRTKDQVGIELDAAKKQLTEVMALMHKEGEQLNVPAVKFVGTLNTGLDKAAKKLQETIAKLTEAKNKQLRDFALEGLGKQIETMIKSGEGGAAFDSLLQQFKEATSTGILAGMQESIDKGVWSESEAKAQADKEAQVKVDAYVDEMSDAAKDVADKQAEELKKAFDEAAQFWRGIWDELINTGTLDFGRMLKEVAASFLGDITAGILGGPPGGGMGGIGSMLAQVVLGSVMSSFGGSAGAGAAGGMGGGLGGMAAAGVGGYLASTGVGAGFTAGMMGTGVGTAASGGVMTAGGATVGAGSYAAGSYVAAAAPYLAIAAAIYMIGDKQGWWGNRKPQNDETKARDRTESMLENRLGRNFVFGDIHRFNPGKNGWDTFNTMTDDQKALYAGFGEGLKSLAGTTQDIGGQIGAILADNIGIGVDKAKMLFKELGYSAEEMSQAVIDNGLKMGKTWKEIVDTLRQIDKLSSPGLEGIGDIGGAVQEIVDSAAQGMDAIIALKDLAVEALQGGIKDLGGLRAALSVILPPEQVQQLMDALSKAGIKTMEDLSNASLRTLADIIAYLQEMGFQFAEVQQAAANAGETIHNMGPDPITGDTTQTDQSYASGGVVFGPQRAIVGDSGPEAIIPLTRRGGRLGIRGFNTRGGSGGMVINIDARYAEHGVEQKIMAAMEQAKAEAITGAVDAMNDWRTRGGGLSGFDR
jgi:hypothetical protein